MEPLTEGLIMMVNVSREECRIIKIALNILLEKMATEKKEKNSAKKNEKNPRKGVIKTKIKDENKDWNKKGIHLI